MIRVATFLALLCLTASPAASATWIEVRTPHYLLFGDAAERDMKRIAQRFEQFHALMQQVLSRPAVSSAAPTVVLVFRDAKSFRPYLPLYEGKPIDRVGIFTRDGYINYVGINAEGGPASYPIVFHELVHQIAANVSEISATWFHEGLAEYYSSFELRGETEVLLGKPISAHALLLREQFMPLRELLAVDHSSPVYNEDRRSSVFYAQSWALLHFLRFSPGTRERFDEFMRLAERGTPQAQAITTAFGMPLAKIEASLRTYVQQFSMLMERKRLEAPLGDADVRTSVTTEQAVLPYLAGLQAAVGREDEAERRLEAAGTASQSAGVRAVLAQIRLSKDRPDDALRLLLEDVPYPAFLDHYLAAATLAQYLRGGRTAASGPARDALRLHAKAATADRTDVPEAWRLLALAHLLADEPKEAQAAIERALLLAPANDYYRFTYADTLVRQHEFTKARSVLGGLMAHGRTSDIRTDARRMMGSVVTYELALQRGTTPAPDAVPAANEDRAQPDSGRSTQHPQAPADRAAAFTPVFRKVEPGETRVYGTLVEISCSRDRSVTLVLQVDGAPLRVSARAMDRIDFITYRDDLTGRVSCGVRGQADPVFVTWRGAAAVSGAVEAEQIAVEFTPKGYKPR